MFLFECAMFQKPASTMSNQTYLNSLREMLNDFRRWNGNPDAKDSESTAKPTTDSTSQIAHIVRYHRTLGNVLTKLPPEQGDLSKVNDNSVIQNLTIKARSKS